ncbi:hypothetical protein Bbelb_216840 [Branchiostoma belcheri]|nr:hypothetical protein Bbelb_216840 [Branchiostoma belcheri]
MNTLGRKGKPCQDWLDANLPTSEPLIETKRAAFLCLQENPLTTDSCSTQERMKQQTSVSDMAFNSIEELPIMRSLTKCLPWISLANVLLYGSETWITYKRWERLLNSFHMKCLMRNLGLSWQDRTPYSVILQRARVPIMYTLLSKRCLRCLGHFRRMEDDNWETLAMDRSAWKLSLQKGIMEADSKRGSDTAAKRAKRSQATPATSYMYICTTCGRACNSHVGHYSHRRRYPPRRQTK